jgi:uroporphyrinogen-III synthase
MQQIIAKIHTPEVQDAIAAERFILNKLDGGCLLPLGAYCEMRNNDFRLWVSLQTDSGMRRLFIQGKNPRLMAQKALIQLTAPQVGTVYISRDPEDAHLFINLVGAAGYSVIAQNPVHYETIELKNLPEFDWIFFSSIRSVDHFLTQWPIPHSRKIGALGSGTAAALRQHGYSPDFIGGDGNTRKTAAEFAEITEGQTVFFPVASEGLRSIQREIESKALVIEYPVYRTISNPDFIPPKADIYVFTSPSCVHAFASSGGNFGLKVIAIGRSTAEALGMYHVNKVFQPPFTTEESLADLVCGL